MWREAQIKPRIEQNRKCLIRNGESLKKPTALWVFLIFCTVLRAKRGFVLRLETHVTSFESSNYLTLWILYTEYVRPPYVVYTGCNNTRCTFFERQMIWQKKNLVWFIINRDAQIDGDCSTIVYHTLLGSDSSHKFYLIKTLIQY